ncbi:MAG: Gfo/Idh/MocA family oxidoreductase, partial [Clostridia bacterium]|nr:Gfo/Idh/MocA family oxidoreductase [Clostridia bacterium]
MDEQHEEKLRLGVIGSGWIADEMIHGAVSTGCFTVTAVYSRTLQRAQEFAEKHREPQQPVPRCFTDLEEMAVSPDVDAVYIASPNVCHV